MAETLAWFLGSNSIESRCARIFLRYAQDLLFDQPVAQTDAQKRRTSLHLVENEETQGNFP
jgi:alpha-D-ribose 1-methylphosphonate 5-triphosphate synthase subunit PhnL